MPKMIRLDKFLSDQSLISRKDARGAVRQKRVTVDGVVVQKADAKLNPLKSKVMLDGEEIEYKEYIYIMMNKPGGVITASEDSREETVIDLLPIEMKRQKLFPAGRLDRDTTGLLIITDDGEFAHKMLAPKSHIYKHYIIESENPISERDIKYFREGIEKGADRFAPAELEILASEDGYMSKVKIREGKFHQVKRMYEAINNKVINLKRVQIGNLILDANLSEGEARYITESEKEKIFEKATCT